jgi:hypothetical protein
MELSRRSGGGRVFGWFASGGARAFPFGDIQLHLEPYGGLLNRLFLAIVFDLHESLFHKLHIIISMIQLDRPSTIACSSRLKLGGILALQFVALVKPQYERLSC